MNQKNTAKKRDQRRRETFFRESRREVPEVVIFGPIGENLKKKVSRDLLAIR